MRRAAIAAVVVYCLASILAVVPAWARDTRGRERTDGRWYTMVDEKGRTVLTTGIRLAPGDRFIGEGDETYEVYRVEGDTVFAHTLGEASLPDYAERGLAGINLPLTSPVPVQGPESRPVAIYHTHSDESYQPSDGADAIPARGGIFQVGAAFARALQDKGLPAVQDLTPHEPHDDAAYDRSRRTAVLLLRRRPPPIAIFDVHRDAAPPGAYEVTVDGRNVAQVMMVVGRENPITSANLTFARLLKREADRLHPRLVRGILIINADYNQDLSPRALLLEAGSNNSLREEAEDGMAMLADAIPPTLSLALPRAQPKVARESRGSWKALLVIILLTLGGGAGYLLVATGGLEEARARLEKWRREEFGDVVDTVRGALDMFGARIKTGLEEGRRRYRRHRRGKEEV